MQDSNEIMALEHKRRQAMIAADVTTLSGLLDDDLLWIHANARADTKAGVLGSIESGKSQYQSIECSDETLRFVGDTALLSGIANMKARIAGEDRLLENRFTIVWARREGEWKVVNWQSTSVRKPA